MNAWSAGRTLVVIAVLFGVQLIVTGIFRFVAAFAADDLTGGTRVLLAVLGVLSLIIGLYAVRHVLVTVLALALLLGIFWIVNGSVELFMALSHREMANRGWSAVMGILSIFAGIIVLAARPPLDVTLDEETQARLPLIFGGISVALAKTFKFIDAELKAVHTEEWERTFSLFRLLI